MKKSLLLIICLFVVLAVPAQQIPAKPNPPRLVNDLVGLLTTDQRDSLENKLVAYDDSTSNQVAIVIVPTLNDYAPVDYAVKLGREWGVGGKEFNNGVIILISTGADGTQRKVFIATGYGLEGAIPDITAQRIVDHELVPHLREGDFFRALNNATDAIIRAAAGEYRAPTGYADRGRAPSRGRNLPILPFLAIIVIIWLISRRGGGGGRGGGFMSRRGYRRSAPPIWWFPTGGGGGGWSGGGGGFGGGGGGFGGFGGGSFGGGGAGGNW